jgi:hypothetical protein
LNKQGKSLYKPGCKFSSQQSLRNEKRLGHEQCLRSSRGFCSRKSIYHDSAEGKTNARELLPEDDVWFGNGRMGREEIYNGMGVGGSNGGEEGRGVEGASIEEVGGFCEVRDVSDYRWKCD